MGIIFILIQVILLDAILSIDNAAALGAIAITLPEKQRVNALRFGILGAYVGRGLMLLLTGFLIANPWIRLVGAGYLIYLVGTHFFNFKKWEPEFKGLSTFWKTVILIEIADLAFSIDNVVAVVAISQQIQWVIVGVFISILLMRFAAQFFMKLIELEPMLAHAAYILILAIAIELVLKFFKINIPEAMQFSISMFILAAFVLLGQIKRRTGVIIYEHR